MKVIEASRTGKGQFYHYFRSKEGLIHEVLQTYLDEIKAGVSRVNYEIISWKDLQKWFASQVELQKDYEMTRGCPFGTLGNEVTDNDELVRQDLSLIFEVVKNKLAAFFVREKAKGRLAKQADPERIADFCIASMQGAMLMGKVKRSSQTVEASAPQELFSKELNVASSCPLGRIHDSERRGSAHEVSALPEITSDFPVRRKRDECCYR